MTAAFTFLSCTGPAIGSVVSTTSAASKAADFLVSRFDPASPPNALAEVLVSLSAVGSAVGSNHDVVAQGLTQIQTAGPQDAAREAAYAGRIVMALVAYGKNPSEFGGFNYVRSIEAAYNSENGSYDQRNRIYADALAALGLLAAGRTLPQRAVDFLRANECPGGGFGHAPGCPTGADTDTTAMVSSTLLAAGIATSDGVIERALLFLKLTQNADGGFGLGAATPTNANSTGLTLSFFASAGQRAADWSKGQGNDPTTALLALQNEDGGFRYRSNLPRSNHYATVQSIPGLMARKYPPEPIEYGEATKPQLSPAVRQSGSRPLATPPLAHIASPSSGTTVATGQEPSPTWVVIGFPGGATETFCVFVKDGASGLAALEATGLAITKRDFGGALGVAICSLRGVGNPIDSCPGSQQYWHYWQFDDDRWTQSSQGASNRVIDRRSADAWTWADDRFAAAPPKTIPLGVCSASKTAASTLSKGISKMRSLHISAVFVAFAMMGLLAMRIRLRRRHG